MVYRASIDEATWNDMKSRFTDCDQNRDSFAYVLLNYIISIETIERVEVRLPSTLTKEERHTIYKLNKKRLFKSVKETYETSNTCMVVYLSKPYVKALLDE
jgi:hypothetical protein